MTEVWQSFLFKHQSSDFLNVPFSSQLSASLSRCRRRFLSVSDYNSGCFCSDSLDCFSCYNINRENKQRNNEKAMYVLSILGGGSNSRQQCSQDRWPPDKHSKKLLVWITGRSSGEYIVFLAELRLWTLVEFKERRISYCSQELHSTVDENLCLFSNDETLVLLDLRIEVVQFLH